MAGLIPIVEMDQPPAQYRFEELPESRDTQSRQSCVAWMDGGTANPYPDEVYRVVLPPFSYGDSVTASTQIRMDGSLPDVIRRLEGFASLGDDWDSYGGKAPSQKATESARHLVSVLWDRYRQYDQELPPGHISPIPNGGIHMRWDSAEREANVDIGPSGSLEYLHVTSTEGQQFFREEYNVGMEEILTLIANTLEIGLAE